MSGRHTPNPVMTYTICADIGELRGIFPSPVFMFVTRFSEPHFSFVLSCTTFWCHLWSITVQTHGNMESGILHWCSSFNYFWIGSKCCWFQMLLVSNTASSRCCTKLHETISSSGRYVLQVSMIHGFVPMRNKHAHTSVTGNNLWDMNVYGSE